MFLLLEQTKIVSLTILFIIIIITIIIIIIVDMAIDQCQGLFICLLFLSVAKCRGSWVEVVGRGCESWVWVWVIVVGKKPSKKK